MLDTLLGAGEVTWIGVEPLGDRDGRIALYLTDHLAQAAAAGRARRRAHRRADRPRNAIVAYLHRNGASFFGPLHEAAGGGFPQETVDAFWDLVWKGLVTNDTLHALRAYCVAAGAHAAARHGPRTFRSRRLIPPSAEGRWTRRASCRPRRPPTWATAMAQSAARRATAS